MRVRNILVCGLIAVLPLAGAVPATAQEAVVEHAESTTFSDDARSLEGLINKYYAYLDRLPGNTFRLTPRLALEADRVLDERTLLQFLERALLLLGDHHAITGSSLSSSWAVVPSYADMWVETRSGQFEVTAVRRGSPADTARIKPGSIVVAIDDVPIAQAVDRFAEDLGQARGAPWDAFAARILLAGKRDRLRAFTLRTPKGVLRRYVLPNLYQLPARSDAPVSISKSGEAAVITINNSLGDMKTIAAFDAAMATIGAETPLVIDLTDTPSGGNTTVARAIMGWFVDQATAYQRHALPSEERDTGIARAWLELVMPRAGKRHTGPVTIRVGRWTGSMGEGLAIGLQQTGGQLCGGQLCGGPMAGLLGAVNDYVVGASGLTIKLPFERLSTVDGTPREAVSSPPCPAS